MSRGELVDAATQVAGNHAHGRMAKQSKCGAWFYKPHVGDARSETELTFYAEVHRSARLSDSANAEEAVEVEEAVMLKSGGEGGAVVDDVDAAVVDGDGERERRIVDRAAHRRLGNRRVAPALQVAVDLVLQLCVRGAAVEGVA